jgi:DNA-binding SARP family transcriptional activator
MDDDVVSPVALGLVRGFTLSVDDRRIPLSWSAQRLVAFLAFQDRPLVRSYVAGKLWPDTTSLKASANLRSSLWRAQGACRRLIDTSAQQLSLAAHVVVDVRESQAGAYRLLDAGTSCDDVLTTEVRSALASDLLPDWYDDDWLIVEREKYRQLRLHALEAMCARLVSAGRYGEAVEAGLAAVRAEPLRESAQQALIKAHLAAGNRWEALCQFDRCRRLLLAELGLEPSAELCLLVPTISSFTRRRRDGPVHPARRVTVVDTSVVT